MEKGEGGREKEAKTTARLPHGWLPQEWESGPRRRRGGDCGTGAEAIAVAGAGDGVGAGGCSLGFACRPAQGA
jgi:hypothetical protein